MSPLRNCQQGGNSENNLHCDVTSALGYRSRFGERSVLPATDDTTVARVLVKPNRAAVNSDRLSRLYRKSRPRSPCQRLFEFNWIVSQLSRT